MKSIHVSNNQFKIGSEVRPIVTRTSFCLLGHYQAGNRDAAKRWLDRIQAQGFDGPRLFGENQDWFQGSPIFFGSNLTPKVTAFGNHSGPFSNLRLIDGYERFITMLAEDLNERSMIAEFCCIATVKGREPAWTSHGLNCFAQMFSSLFPDPNKTPFLHEAINEWDAHSSLSGDPDEIARIGRRWRRSNHEDPSHHNYPGSTIGVSAGGQWTPGFDDLGYTHRNIHPPRGENWWLGENGNSLESTIRKLQNFSNRPVYLNETIHYMTQDQWDEWIPKASKWAGLSTTNHQKLAQYLHDVRALGASVCFHDLIGMSTDPNAEITNGERAVAEMLGGQTAPPPPPVQTGALQHVATHRAIYGDDRIVAYKLERLPNVVHGGSETFVLREKIKFKFDNPGTIIRVDVFHGNDIGDIVEMDTEIYTEAGIPIFLRSDHKETSGQYAGWTGHSLAIRAGGADVSITCRVNAPNARTRLLQGRPHWGIWIVVVE
jgi:hypothetical protein